MLPALMLVPAGTSLILGVVFLTMEDGHRVAKTVGCVVFIVAAYLQFYSRLPLAGLLLQIGLALSLAIWRRLSTIA